MPILKNHVDNLIELRTDLEDAIEQINDAVRLSNETTATQRTLHNRRCSKVYLKTKKKFRNLEPADPDLFKNKPEFEPVYSDHWTDLVSFECCDAANPL